MNIMKIAFELFVFYLLYKLVLDFIIPVAKTTKQVKKQFTEMNSKMEEQMRQQQSRQYNNNSSQEHTAPNKASNSDYIDFEEVK